MIIFLPLGSVMPVVAYFTAGASVCRQITYIFVGRSRHPVFGKEMWCQRM